MHPANEHKLRRGLGIPDDARHVIVFAESSHWDPDWLYTSEHYYGQLVERNLDAAVKALLDEPRRVYSVECMFFLRMYWDRRPEMRDMVRQLINRGRMRLTSSGVTTADTLLPSAEAILRDMLIGQEWLRGNGMTAEPRLAYFTDSFGCSPALPSLLRAAGFDRMALSRIDGMYFAGSDLESADRFPRQGSSAALLLQDEQNLDFVWRDMNGAEVLCHWNAFTYGQGDLLAHGGISRVYLFPLAFPNPSERRVSSRIESYHKQLAPLSRTPYLFCPIGMDFVEPIPGLVELLDRYNSIRYPSTGIWAVNAGLDDYLALVECHREQLPTLTLDPNPYWTGFYSTRPALKKRCHDLVDRLLLAEALALLPENEAIAPAIMEEITPAWWDAAVSNHHDFITGTSPDSVVEGEQIPWLDRSQARVDAALQRMTPAAPPTEPGRDIGPAQPPRWTRDGGITRIETPYYIVSMPENAGGALSASAPGTEGSLLLADSSNDLISSHDSGGLWRMGHEYRGGWLRPGARSSSQRAPVWFHERDHHLEASCEVTLNGETLRRTLWFHAGSPLVFGRVEGLAARRQTVTLAFETSLSPVQVVMAQPGGVVTRPLEKVYRPTFWPMQEFAYVEQADGGRGVAFFVNSPTAIACSPEGRIELVTLRNATKERAFGLLPLPANPASGRERIPFAFEYAVMFTTGCGWRNHDLPRIARLVSARFREVGPASLLYARAMSPITVEGPDAAVMAVKRASRGEGIIVRLLSYEMRGEPITVALLDRTVRTAYLCDARERDLEPLSVRNGRVRLTLRASVTTLRLLPE